MEIFRIQIKPQADIERHEGFKKTQHNCPICTMSLEFELLPGPTDIHVIEKANCPHCELEIRCETHVEQ